MFPCFFAHLAIRIAVAVVRGVEIGPSTKALLVLPSSMAAAAALLHVGTIQGKGCEPGVRANHVFGKRSGGGHDSRLCIPANVGGGCSIKTRLGKETNTGHEEVLTFHVSRSKPASIFASSLSAAVPSLG